MENGNRSKNNVTIEYVQVGKKNKVKVKVILIQYQQVLNKK